MPSASETDPPQPGVPPSKPLQIFLLVALLISGAAYVVDQWTDVTTEETMANRPSKLHRLVENQNLYLTNTYLGHEAEEKKRYDEAVAYYRRALRGQDTAEGHLNLGAVLLDEGNPDMAFSQFKDAVRLDPHFEPAYVAWGRALVFQGRADDAVQIYDDALRHNPKFAEVHYNFALALEQKEQKAQAAQHAAEMAHDSTTATQAAGDARFFGAEAVKHYAAAAELGLNTPEFWASYGTLLNRQEDFAKAAESLGKAVQQRPDLGAAQFQLALAYERQGKYAEAIAHYEATLADVPDDPAALNSLALLYTTASDPEIRSAKMAILLATRACDSTANQNARYLDTLARAYAADGDFYQAISWEDKAVRRATQLRDHDLLRELEPRFSLYVQHKSG
jgi:tetratricopeptide (TPR) repeat protein